MAKEKAKTATVEVTTELTNVALAAAIADAIYTLCPNVTLRQKIRVQTVQPVRKVVEE